MNIFKYMYIYIYVCLYTHIYVTRDNVLRSVLLALWSGS